jgi:hypothetical protein
MSFGEVLADCMDKWRGEGIALLPPIAEAEIRDLWCQFGHRVSEDVLLLYSTVGGFGEGHFDEGLFWQLWTFRDLREENLGYPTAGVKFCDHSIRVVTWDLRFEDERHSSVWLSDENSRCMACLELFFQTYLDDPWQILYSA